MSPAGGSCPECGAPSRDRLTCREQFERLLALEYEHPGAYGKVHFLTVASYNLQHPSGFTQPALDWLLDTLQRAIAKDLPPAEIRRIARVSLPQMGKITQKPKDGGAAAARVWSMTVADIPVGDPVEYTAAVRAWAGAVTGALQRSRDEERQPPSGTG